MAKKKAEATVETKPVEETAVAVIEKNGDPSAFEAGLNTNAGTFALAMMNDQVFDEQLAIMKRGRDRIARIQREMMEVDIDYGLIPGTPKPTLFKPGAEKLAQIYGLAAQVDSQFYAGNGETEPPLRYETQCYLHLRSFDGPIVAQGHGSANSWEKRYRRAGSRVCPECGKAAIIKSKFNPGWYCFPKNGGCGTNFRVDDVRLQNEAATDPKGEPVEQFDLGNTLLKMSEKRAFVDAVLRATASSGLFTQDVADEPADELEAQQMAEETIRVTTGGVVVDPDGQVVDMTGNPDEDHAAADQTGSDRPIEEHEPEARPNHVEGVGRGGRTEDGSTVQIAQIKALSKGMKLGPHGLVGVASKVLGDDGGVGSPPILPESPTEAVPVVTQWLNHLPAKAAGALLTELRSMEARR